MGLLAEIHQANSELEKTYVDSKGKIIRNPDQKKYRTQLDAAEAKLKQEYKNRKEKLSITESTALPERLGKQALRDQNKKTAIRRSSEQALKRLGNLQKQLLWEEQSTMMSDKWIQERDGPIGDKQYAFQETKEKITSAKKTLEKANEERKKLGMQPLPVPQYQSDPSLAQIDSQTERDFERSTKLLDAQKKLQAFHEAAQKLRDSKAESPFASHEAENNDLEKARKEFDSANAKYQKSGGTETLQMPTVALSPNALQANQLLQATEQDRLDDLENKLSEAKKRLQRQKDNPPADNRIFTIDAIQDHPKVAAEKAINDDINKLQRDIDSTKQKLETIVSATVAPQQQAATAAGGTAPTTTPSGATATPQQQAQPDNAGTGFTAWIGNALSNATNWWHGTQTSQNVSSTTAGSSSTTSGGHTSQPAKTKVNPPKASGFLDKWFDSKPKSRSEKTKLSQEKSVHKQQQKKRVTASTTHKKDNITKEWDDTMEKDKEKMSAIISDANSALSK